MEVRKKYGLYTGYKDAIKKNNKDKTSKTTGNLFTTLSKSILPPLFKVMTSHQTSPYNADKLPQSFPYL